MQRFNHPSFHLKSSHVTPVDHIPHLGGTSLILPQTANQNPAREDQVRIDSLGLRREFAEPRGLLQIAQVIREEAKLNPEGSSSPNDSTQAQCSVKRNIPTWPLVWKHRGRA